MWNLYKVNNKDTIINYITLIINVEQICYVILVFLLLTLNK